MRRTTRPVTGFSLLEVVAALAILGSTMVLLVQVLHHTAPVQLASQQQAAALAEVQSAMEQVAAGKWEEMAPALAEKWEFSATAKRLLTQPRWLLQVRDDQGLKHVRITLAWGAAPTVQQVELSAWFAPRRPRP